jgi:uncharacterized repeat protein (TIGR03803 family)
VAPGPDGVLVGTTVFGGRHGGGCVFSLTPKGSSYTERILFSFGGSHGVKPGGNVVADAHGDLFGETVIGGAANAGTVFELVPAGAGYTERVLHSFANAGGPPQPGLTMASDGTLYGTLYGTSAVNPDGTVFRLQLRKTGPVYTDLYNFPGGTAGANPIAALTVDNHTGVIYGTTQYGGTGDNGTVFSLTPSGSGYTERVLHAFASGNAGFGPQAPLLRSANGDLFGTADLGGTRCSGIGCGTVFELTPTGPAYTFRLVYSFTGPPDGAEPQYSGVAAGPGGTLFGTTRSGGTPRTCADGGPGGVHGCGTVYKLTA